MSDEILIKNAAAIVTCDTDDTIWRDCDLLVNGAEIQEIGPNLTAGQAEVIDAAGCFVYPGLINTHHHFFQTFVRDLLTVDYPNMLVLDWIRKIYQIFKRIDADCIYYSSLVAMSDLIKHGCTTAYDHQYCYIHAIGEHPKAAGAAGIDVNRTRYLAVLLNGLFGGLAGSYLTLSPRIRQCFFNVHPMLTQ